MLTIRKASDRGHADHGWLDTWHTFSFADYRDPRWMGFRALRVINEDTVAGGAGFGSHPHQDMEIITCVLAGALQHRDSMGHTTVLKAGDVQRISAGTGILHSEQNYSPIEPVHFLQIWILPDRKGAKPDYAERSFGTTPAQSGLTRMASRDGREGSVRINQDAEVWLGRLDAGSTTAHVLMPGRHAWVHVAAGDVSVNGHPLASGDGAAATDENALELRAAEPSQVLVFDLA